MGAVIIDYRADSQLVCKLKKLGYEVIFSTNNKKVSPELSGHPDMQICKCDDNVFVCAPECYEYYEKALSCLNVKVLCGKTSLADVYPRDIAYNVARIGNIAVCNKAHTDPLVIDTLLYIGVKIVNTSQGYSKCNVCVVNDNAIIISDVGICKALEGSGVETLLIKSGYIDIIGWDYGFIGGASGKISENKLAFCGNLSLHPDGNRMIDFCNKHGVECISLSDKGLTDTGSLILV